MGFLKIENTKYSGDKKYAMGLRVPQYNPTNIDVDLSGCYDKTKYNSLCEIINNSKLSDEKKAIYKLAATRFIEFNFENFAEYYCRLKSDPNNKEEQEIMEKLALVIVDMNDAIMNGFVNMNEFIQDVVDRSKNEKKEEKK